MGRPHIRWAAAAAEALVEPDVALGRPLRLPLGRRPLLLPPAAAAATAGAGRGEVNSRLAGPALRTGSETHGPAQHAHGQQAGHSQQRSTF